MKLISFLAPGAVARTGALLPDGGVLPLNAWPSILALIEAGPAAWDQAKVLAAKPDPAAVIPAGRYQLKAPIPLPPQFRDSMSFHKHIVQSQTSSTLRRARESGDPKRIAEAERFAAEFRIPEVYLRQPVYYKGNRFNVADPGEDIPWPAYSRLMDFELELACVIGRGGKDIARDKAHEHIFGFMIFNDFSARDAQALEMDGRLGPAKGKDFDKANVFGPCLVTADEIGDPYALRMQARVNGETWCDSNSSTMHWRFDDLIAHISAGETLHPGEIIGSGTVGDGCGLEHLRFLKHGDVVELEIEKIGTLRNRVLHPEALHREVA